MTAEPTTKPDAVAAALANQLTWMQRQIDDLTKRNRHLEELLDDHSDEGVAALKTEVGRLTVLARQNELKVQLFDNASASYAASLDESVQKMIAAYDRARTFADENQALKDEVSRLKRQLLLVGGTP